MCVCVCVCVCLTSSLVIHLYLAMGFFHILAIVNSAATNIGVHICFQVIFFLPSDVYLAVDWVDLMVELFLVAVPIYKPTNSSAHQRSVSEIEQTKAEKESLRQSCIC